MHAYRVFLSYAHHDGEQAKQVRNVLKAMGLNPISDQNLRIARNYITEIKALIDRTHLFVPILTEHSVGNRWVHEEIGYAIGAGIPVLALTTNVDPGELLTLDQAVRIPAAVKGLSDVLETAGIEDLISDAGRDSRAAYECPDNFGARTRMLGDFAEKALRLECSEPLRIRAPHSSFCLPGELPVHAIWRTRPDTGNWPEEYHNLWYKERSSLEQYARRNGCRLLLDPTVPYSAKSQAVRKIRLKALLKSLQHMQKEKVDVKVAIDRTAREGNLVIVGDWFYTESLSGVQVRTGHGYRYQQSVFTWNAPRVLHKMREFDEIFDRFGERGQSCARAMQKIEKTIDKIR